MKLAVPPDRPGDCRSWPRVLLPAGREPSAMSAVTAREALDYATTESWMKLYAVLLAAWLLSLVGQFVLTAFGFPQSGVVVAVVLLAATVIFVVWLVAAAFKLLADADQFPPGE